MSKIESVKVEPGQIWQSCDKREDPPRKVRVIACTPGFAYVLNVHAAGGATTRIRLDRMRPTANGFKLVTNADGSAA